jgi:anti-anti-sigma regulatory factor
VARPDTPSAWIQLTGAIDMAVEPALTDAADRLRTRSLRFIVVDLAAVTFVGSTFAKFLATLRRDHPESQLVLHNPSRLARVIVAVTGMEGFVVMSGHPVTSPATAGNRPGRWEAINPRSHRSGGPAVAPIRGRAANTARRPDIADPTGVADPGSGPPPSTP